MSDLHKRLTVRRWSDYVIAVYGPDGRVVEVHDCRETVTAQGKPACQDDSNRCAVWDDRPAGDISTVPGQPAHQERSQRSTGGLGLDRLEGSEARK